MSTPRWICDDDPSLRFPVYTRGNAGEVAPNVMTPLTASLVGDASAEGSQRAMRELGLLRERDFAGPGANGTGIFGGYLYANLSIIRVACSRAPGMTALDADRQMAGVSDDAPAHRPQPGDRDLVATLAMSWSMARHLLRPDVSGLDRVRRDIDRRNRVLPPFSECNDDMLIDLVLGCPRRWADGMYRLLLNSSYAGAATSIVERMAEQAGAAPGTALTLTGGLGTIDSATPAIELWALGRQVAGSTVLTQLFDDGGDVFDSLGDATGDTDVDRFLVGFAAFVAAHGSRGPDEWELASDTWGTNPLIAIAAIDRLREAPEERDPLRAGRRLAAERATATAAVRAGVARPARPVFDRMLRSAQLYAAGRERAKAIFIADMYPIRLALFELAARVRGRGGPSDRNDVFLVTANELSDFVAAAEGFSTVVAERRRQRDFLQERVPPFVFDGVLPDPATWPLRSLGPDGVSDDVRELRGDGVCPGTVRGTVRIIRDPADPGALGPGDILVAPITDPAWTPLFLAVAGVIVEVGAQMSHAAIVARELGIPAIVSVAGATTRLIDGQVVEIDGATGIVTVL